jgi:ankyrin repeat protein
MLMAAKNGDIKEIQRLLEAKGDPNVESPRGNSPLNYAAFYGQARTAEFLIENKADANHRTKAGCFPLMQAAFQNEKETCEVLLRGGADTKMKYLDLTPSDWALKDGYTEVGKFIVNWGTKSE